MKYKIPMALALTFAFVFSLSFGFHITAFAGDAPPEPEGPSPCNNPLHVNQCCEVEIDFVMHRGVCVITPSGMKCECDCIFVNWPTCGGPNNCPIDDCTVSAP